MIQPWQMSIYYPNPCPCCCSSLLSAIELNAINLLQCKVMKKKYQPKCSMFKFIQDKDCRIVVFKHEYLVHSEIVLRNLPNCFLAT